MITLSPQLDWVSLSILNWEFPQILKLNHLIGIFFIWENPQFEMCYETEACPLFVVYSLSHNYQGDRVAQCVWSLDLTTHRSLSPIRRGFAPSFVNYKKGALDSQPKVIKFTSCLPRVGGSLRVIRLPPPLKLVAMI
jgi:hypothetical protein